MNMKQNAICDMFVIYNEVIEHQLSTTWNDAEKVLHNSYVWLANVEMQICLKKLKYSKLDILINMKQNFIQLNNGNKIIQNWTLR